MKYYFIFLMFAFFSTLKAQTLTPEQLKTDLTIVRKALEARHPEMYKYVSQKEFDSLYRSLEDSFSKPMPVQDFYTSMLPLIASLKCGHTKWLPDGRDYYYPFYSDNLFPLKLYFTKGKAYVIGHYTESESPVLAEVISINGNSMKSIISGLLDKLTFADGYSAEGKYFELNNFFSGIYSTHYGIANQYRFEYFNKAHKPETATFSGVNVNAVKAFDEKRHKPDSSPFTFSLIDNEIGWMDINRFYAFPNEPNFNKFLKKSFNELENKKISTLVIDLRGNEGGNEKWGFELYRYLAIDPFRYYNKMSVKKLKKSDFEENISLKYRLLKPFVDRNKMLKLQKPEKSAFRGKVYLLIDGQSYSTATEFASKAKSEGRVIVVGQESAGGYALNTSGFFSIVKLPHSKVELGIPLVGFDMGNSSSKNPMDRGIVPDYEIENLPEDVLSSFDRAKDFVVARIKNNTK